MKMGKLPPVVEEADKLGVLPRVDTQAGALGKSLLQHLSKTAHGPRLALDSVSVNARDAPSV